MNKALSAVILSMVAITGTAFVQAADSGHKDDGTIVAPSDLKDGETKVITDDDRKVTIKRHGDRTEIEVENDGGKNKHVTVIETDGDGQAGNHRHVIIDGKDIDTMVSTRLRGLQAFQHGTWYVCPKDHAMLHIAGKGDGSEAAGATYKCPVDGTTMEKRKGQGFGFLFDSNAFRFDDRDDDND